jgi:phosphoserine phosphatase
MEKRVNELKSEYRKTVADLYFDKRIEYFPKTDYIFINNTHSFGGCCEGKFRKGIISDVDDTLTVGKSLFRNWFDTLSEIKDLTKSIIDEFLDYFSRITESNISNESIKDTTLSIGKRFRECKLRYEEYREAAMYAASQTAITPNSKELVDELERMGYVFSLNSGSPQECVDYFGRRLNIQKRGFGWNGSYRRIYGSIYGFDSEGKATGEIIHGLHFNKEKGMRNFLKGINCPPNLSIFMSDDPKTDIEPALLAGLNIWTVDRSFLDKVRGYEFPGKIKIASTRARIDMNLVLNYVKIWDQYNIVIFLRTPEGQLEFSNIATHFKRVTEEGIKSKDDIETHKLLFLDSAEQLLLFDSIVNRESPDIYNPLSELRTANDGKEIKRLMNDIFTILYYRIPEIQETKENLRDLVAVVEKKKRENISDEEWSLP